MAHHAGKPFNADKPFPKGGKHTGVQLREMRFRVGKTQAEVARLLGFHQSTISRLEGNSEVPSSALADYVRALGAATYVHCESGCLGLRRVRTRETAAGALASEGRLFPNSVNGDDIFRATKHIVFSVKPEYSEKILNGRKTVELRRRFPKALPAGTPAYFYSTSPTRALTCSAVIERVVMQSPQDIWRKFSSQACIGQKEFSSYFSGLEFGFAIVLRSVRPLPRPLPLSELRDRFSFAPPQSFQYAKPQLREALTCECSENSH